MTYNSDLISFVHYKQAEDRDTQQACHRDVESADAIKATKDWRDEMELSGNYRSYSDKIAAMLTEFEEKWDGYLCHMEAVHNRIECTSDEFRPIPSAPDRAIRTERKF